ncbi:YgcG family protein [Treponema phagedenis]|nr:YgcG family protein [Treponema phagedenis]QSH95373.1 hypothetical protein C5O78_10150 [Treponema phagedenis]QSH99856.1 YgcG family protein [Treponema phagedenis]
MQAKSPANLLPAKTKSKFGEENMKKRISVIFLSFLCLVAIALEVPPLKEPVTDLAGILSETEHKEISDFLLKTDSSSALQIAVLIIPSLKGEVLEDYSIRVAKEWKIGQKGKDSGVILLVSKNDRKIRIEVGYGLEGSITDAKAASIIRNVIAPQFKKEKYGEGIYQAVQNIAGLALEDESLISDTLKTEDDYDTLGIVSIILYIIAFFMALPILAVPFVIVIMMLRIIWWTTCLILGIEYKPLFPKFMNSSSGGSYSGSSYSSSSYSSSSSSSYSGGGGSFGGGGASGGW